METTERVVLLCKARELYELSGIFPSHLKNTLNKLFGDVPQQGMCQGSKGAMQAGGMPYIPTCTSSGPAPLLAGASNRLRRASDQPGLSRSPNR